MIFPIFFNFLQNLPMENFSSEFLLNQGWFGKYPDPNELKIIEENNFTDIIDLTTPSDNLPSYQFNGYYWHYPIDDHRTPPDLKKFETFIDQILEILSHDPKRKIYVHCKGGHGRSGVFVASTLKRIYKINHPEATNDEATQYALNLTYNLHQQRKIMKSQWRRVGAPQTQAQRDFVKNIFQ